MGKKEKAPCLRFKDTNGKDYPAWEQRELCEVAKVTMGQSPRGENYTSDPNDKILIQGNADLRNGWVCPRVWTKEVTKTCNKGDIIFSVRAPVGDVGKTAYDAVIGRGVASIKGSDFVFQTLQYLKQKGYWTKVSAGSTFDSVNSDTLRKTLIQIPIDPQEQAKIGEFFSSLDGAITLHQRKLETLKKLKRTLLQKMFPKKGQLKPELRFPGFTNDWEQRKLGELAATFGYGLNAAAKSFDGRHKYIRITDIDESTRRFLCSSLTSPDIDFEEAAPYRLAEGDVLFARTGASVGKSYRYVRTDGEVYFAGFLIRFRFKDKEAAEFVFQNSLTAKFQNFIKTSSQRSGQPGINAQQFSGYQIAVPNSEERERIGSFFSRLDTAITLHQRKLETYKKLKKSLLQKMFI